MSKKRIIFFSIATCLLIFLSIILFQNYLVKTQSISFSSKGEAFNLTNVLELKDVDKIDFSKPTVCTITINSSDEKEVFNKYLNKDFNFIELVDEENDDWFKNSCESGLECDILIISGNFGGSFFGKSRHRLSTASLENYSCQKACPGILKKPKEVFLFGCNTTAGKEPDSRTAAEYANILYSEHRDVYTSRAMAEVHAAFRYSSVGRETQDKMRGIFLNAMIYGFHSVAPSGKYIKGQLEKYFSSIKNYSERINLRSRDTRVWNKYMKPFYNIKTVQGNESGENPICILGSDEPIYKKLSWLDSVFKTENEVLTYAPNINEYLKNLEKKFGMDLDKWPKEEVSYFERLQFNKEAKKTVGKFLQFPLKGVLAIQIDVLDMGKRVGWYTKKEIRKIQKNLVGDLFKENLSIEEKDRICSMDIEFNLNLEDITKDKWSVPTIQGLGCVKPQDEKVHLVLVKLLKNSDLRTHLSIADVLEKLKPQDEKVYLVLVKLLKSSDLRIYLSAADILEKLKPQNEKVHLALAKLLKDSDRYVRLSAINVLREVKSQNKKVHLVLVESLKDSDRYINAVAGWILGETKPQDEETIAAIVELLKDLSPDVRGFAAKVLGKIKPQNEKVHLALAKLLKDSDIDARTEAILALRKIKPSGEKVHLALVTALKDSSLHIRKIAATIFGAIKPQNEKVHLALAKTLKNLEPYSREIVLKALEKIKPQNQEVLRLMKKAN